ncbi:MAG: FTR1 family iron permease [Deltaproteobacteria bacterium]|nr:FTR1 family iron permease [Deltaproteobacteria bacterium]
MTPIRRRLAALLAAAVLAVASLSLMATAAAAATPHDLAAAIREAAARYPAGDPHLVVGDAFLQFETSPADADLKGRNPSRYADLEVRWLGLVAAMKAGAPAGEVREQATALAAMLDDLGGDAAATGSRSSLFVDAFLIIVREGFEAILVLTALAAYLVKVRQGDKRRLLYAGAGLALAASAALAAVARFVMPVGGDAREALEGITMLVAAGVLFTASYWLISKSEASRWREFVRTKLEGALSSRRRGALFALAFLVVFREGFETVLFYGALLARAQAVTSASAVWSGFVAGSLLLAIVAVLLFRYGIRIPIRPFFAVTGVLLYVLAFKFAGGGVRELQEAGWIGVTPAPVPNVAWLRDWLAIYPFAEPLLVQAALILAVVAGVGYAALTRPGSEAAAPEALRS